MAGIYTVSEIRDAYCDLENPDPKFLDDLIWHIENDEKPCRAISVAADFALLEAAPYIVRHLNHSDSYERQFAASHLSRLRLPEYAGHIYEMAKADQNRGSRDMAIFSLRLLIDLVDRDMQEKIAELMLESIMLHTTIKTAYDSILHVINEKYEVGKLLPMYPDFVDLEKVQKFRIKYNI